MNEIKDVFISYAREDQDKARALVTAFEARGWSVFWDRALIPGQGFEEIIQQHLDSARCMIVLWSHVSVMSPWVKDEAAVGRERGRLISVLIEDVQPPLGFRQGQVARLDMWDCDPNDQLLEPLIEGLRTHVTSVTKIPETKTPVNKIVVTKDSVVTHPILPDSLVIRSGWVAPTLLLIFVFILNFVQTTFDSEMTPTWLGRDAGYPLVEGFRWFEGNLSFASHEVISMIAVRGYTASYFFLFPIISIGVAIALARRNDNLPYQTFALAVAIVYFLSLPFFILLPIPERWAFPESNAILLSDILNPFFIEAFRPMSGLDNCFPSFHTSLSVLTTVTAYCFELRFRFTILALCSTIVLATVALGIHWIPDVIAGTLLGVLSVLLARRLIKVRSVTWLGLHG